MAEKPQRVQICLAPCIRNDERNMAGVKDKLEALLKSQNINNPLVIGHPTYSWHDYSVENLNVDSAQRLVDGVNQLEGCAAKYQNWYS